MLQDGSAFETELVSTSKALAPLYSPHQRGKSVQTGKKMKCNADSNTNIVTRLCPASSLNLSYIVDLHVILQIGLPIGTSFLSR